MNRILKTALFVLAGLVIAGAAIATPALYQAATLPRLEAENAQGRVADQIVVTARFRRIVNLGAFDRQRLQTYLWRDDRWQPLQIVESDTHGQARLMLATGTYPQAGKHLIGWKLIDDSAEQTIKVSTVTITP